jgi:hypothetical protein
LEIEVNGQIERVEMPDGQVELSADRYAKARLDPQMWILKESRLIDVTPAQNSGSQSFPLPR